MTAKNRLRLLMSADAVGGVWQYAVELAGALEPLGIDATLAVLGPSPSEDLRRFAAETAPRAAILDTGLPLDWLSENEAPVLAAARALAGLATDTGADLVQLNSPALAAAAACPVPVVAVAHGCVASWWDACGDGPLPESFRWHAGLVRRGLLAANAVVAPSAAYAADLARVYALPEPPRAVHNGRGGAPTPAGFGTPAPQAFSAGRLWDRAKDTATLDAVAARLSAPLRAAGPVEAPHGERVEPRHVALLGRLDAAAMARALAARPVFVSTARFEPFGLAVLEAAAHGCPLVLADIPVFRELWDGVARFAPPGDADAFAAATNALLADEAARDRLGREAAARAARYAPAATAKVMAALYRGLLPAADTQLKVAS
ncbi:glycosyltransferase [Antarcticirhabdus aurantiaca]|uniref:Glycosyltransferase n=1 Tax=Antarcticirhabdus aurantiaca TaxID=2606717 RepID=A0ACD4NR92_9HYPH|nr:glycosyltransferase [Antarcticirhabdus aurantiaca]WAJ29216.1 glycosyltransferase [Jeongeuplla avenae]